MSTHSKIHPQTYSIMRHGKVRPKQSTVTDVLNAVIQVFNVDYGSLRGKSRKRELVRARQCAMFFLRKMAGCTFDQTARIFGRSHATAIHGIEAWENELRYSDMAELHSRVLVKLST